MTVRSLVISTSLHMICVGGGIMLQSINVKLGITFALFGPFAILLTLTATTAASLAQRQKRSTRRTYRKVA